MRIKRIYTRFNKGLIRYVRIHDSRFLPLLCLFTVVFYLITPGQNALKPTEVLATRSYNWYPGYYVLAAASTTAAAKERIMDDPLTASFDGYQFRYNWADSELSPGDYSAGFAMLDADLAQVAARNKKLFVMLMYKKFDGSPTVPTDLRSGPGPWCSGSYCGELIVGDTHLALLWNSAVEARLKNWLTAMASHLASSPYINNVAGIVLPETSLGTTDKTILSDAGYDPYVYIQAIQSNLLATTNAAEQLVTFYNHEGGFVSMDGKPVYAGEIMGDWMLQHPRIGTGTPDAKPLDPKTSAHPCANSKYQGLIPCLPEVQAPDYALDRTDSIDSTFYYSLSPAPTGLFGSFISFSYAVGTGPNAFDFADVSDYIKTHPIPAQNAAAPWADPAAIPLLDDINGDPVVNILDYTLLLNAFD